MCWLWGTRCAWRGRDRPRRRGWATPRNAGDGRRAGTRGVSPLRLFGRGVCPVRAAGAETRCGRVPTAAETESIRVREPSNRPSRTGNVNPRDARGWKNAPKAKIRYPARGAGAGPPDWTRAAVERGQVRRRRRARIGFACGRGHVAGRFVVGEASDRGRRRARARDLTPRHPGAIVVRDGVDGEPGDRRPGSHTMGTPLLHRETRGDHIGSGRDPLRPRDASPSAPLGVGRVPFASPGLLVEGFDGRGRGASALHPAGILASPWERRRRRRRRDALRPPPRGCRRAPRDPPRLAVRPLHRRGRAPPRASPLRAEHRPQRQRERHRPLRSRPRHARPQPPRRQTRRLLGT